MLIFLIQGFSLGVSATASPGPFQAYVIGQSIQNGWRCTLPAAAAPLLTDGPIIGLTLLLLSNIPAQFLQLIRIIGGIFVIYLAYKSFVSFKHYQPARQTTTQNSTRQNLIQAALMNFLSPGPYLFWSLIGGPALLRGWQLAPANGLGFLFGFYFAMVGGLALLIVLFDRARQLGPQVSRILLGISALALTGFGVYQLIEGFFG